MMNNIQLGVYAPLNMHRFAGDSARIVELISGLRSFGVSTQAFIPRGGDPDIASRLSPYEEYWTPNFSGAFSRYLGIALTAQYFIPSRLMSPEFDVIQVEWSYALPFSKLRRLARKSNVLFDMHSIAAIDLMPYFPRFLQKLVTNVIHSAQDYICMNSRCFVVSDAMKRYILSRLEVDPALIHVIPNGVNLRVAEESIRTNRARFVSLRKQSDLLLVYVGGLEWYEGVDLIIEAIVEIKQLVAGVRLVIAGRGSEDKNLRELVIRLGLRENVVFLGWLKYEETFALQSIADILVAPRRPLTKHGIDISTPIKIPSYLTAGVPIIASLIGEIPVVARNGKESFLVKNITPQGFSDAIMNLWNKPEIMNTLGVNCLKRAELYSWDCIAQKMIEVYEDIVNT